MVEYTRAGGRHTAGTGQLGPSFGSAQGYDPMQDYARYFAQEAGKPENRIAALERNVEVMLRREEALIERLAWAEQRISSLEARMEGGEETHCMAPKVDVDGIVGRRAHAFFLDMGDRVLKVTVQDA